MIRYFYQNIPLPDYEQLVNCIHCGMCLSTCPTYEMTGLERHSPRGRIRMIKAVADGEMQITPNFTDSMNYCLDCQACVTACPAGVKSGRLIEAAQHHIEAGKIDNGKIPFIKKIALNWIFLDLKNLRFIGKLMRFYQTSGMEKIVQKLGLLKIFSKKLHNLSLMAPKIASGGVEKRLQYNNIPNAKNIRVGIVTGCVQNVFFSDVNKDTAEVLIINGYEVFVPKNQQCCGSVHGHNGDLKAAKILAKNMIDTFTEKEVDYIALNSAGCGSFMKEYHRLLGDDPEYAEKAKILPPKLKILAKYLSNVAGNLPNFL